MRFRGAELYIHAHKIAGLRGLPKPMHVNIMRVYPATVEIVETLAQETDALIESNWPAIIRVAKALHHNAVLKQDAIDRLIAG
jgi:hypothetical protein